MAAEVTTYFELSLAKKIIIEGIAGQQQEDTKSICGSSINHRKKYVTEWFKLVKLEDARSSSFKCFSNEHWLVKLL